LKRNSLLAHQSSHLLLLPSWKWGHKREFQTLALWGHLTSGKAQATLEQDEQLQAAPLEELRMNKWDARRSFPYPSLFILPIVSQENKNTPRKK
jgi:hypothetical protein